MTNPTDTAHQAWNDAWRSPERRAAWETPAPDVAALAEELRRRDGFRRMLDVGCGVGRHALLGARLGFEVVATDLAEAGIAELARKAAAEGLGIATRIAPITALPFAEAAFDFVLAFNVVYHGDGAIVAAALAEIGRVLRPGGVVQATMLSKRNVLFGQGSEVAADTFVNTAGSDKMHPHFYCNAAELVALLRGFELLSLQDIDHTGRGHWHWHLVAERAARAPE
jgi:SAM-dependent methyltransferase